MSEPLEDEAEVIDGLPVLPDDPAGVEADAARSRALAVRLTAPVQATAAALGGFLAGVAVVGLLNRRQGKRPGRALALRRRPGARRAGKGSRGVASELVQVVASRSLLVDVHLLGSSSNERP